MPRNRKEDNGLPDLAGKPATINDIARLADTALERFGSLDIALANAGTASLGPVTEMDLAEWSRVLDVNLTGPMLTIKHAGRRMARGGSIVVTASLNAVQAGNGMGAYCTSKAGVAMLAQVAAIELIGLASDVERAVATDATSFFDLESCAYFFNVDRPALLLPLVPNHLGTAPQEPSVSSLVVVLIEPRPKSDIEIVQAAERREMVEAPLAKRAPKSLHFPSRLRVVRLRVQERRAHAMARHAQYLSSIRRAVVEVQGRRGSLSLHHLGKEMQHVDLLLGVHRFERHHVPRGIVHDAVDAHRLLLSVSGDAGRVVAHVRVIQGARILRFPAQPLFWLPR